MENMIAGSQERNIKHTTMFFLLVPFLLPFFCLCVCVGGEGGGGGGVFSP